MDLNNEDAIVLTLDAGGTNFVFSALQRNKEIVDHISLPAYADDLGQCINSVISGFEQVRAQVTQKIAAISFAFPGPANYELGIIGNLPNFGAFNGGVPLGPMLEDYFKIPVFINNDGDLFAYGEALMGALPAINSRLKIKGSPKQYKNLIGLTLGTGFGAGIVIDGVLLKGDNSCGAEIHNTLNPINQEWNAEESVSTRAILREYRANGGDDSLAELTPKHIADIANGLTEGDRQAAIQSYKSYGRGLGAAIGNILTLIDGLVVIGGGITQSWELFSSSLFEELDRKFKSGSEVHDRLSYKVFNLENPGQFESFSTGNRRTITVEGSRREINYDDMPRTGVVLSKIGASKATWLGSYAYALEMLKKSNLSSPDHLH